ncbi:cytochrome P450 2K1-like [Salminus brasiliensis]|uniref:cytochrome P450 2K1-like n=1 Tax=Salminus brasiliensis TaxID=930266 RepID=UPI003B831526
MALVEGLLLQASSTSILLGVLLILFIYLFFSGSGSQKEGLEPPGPKPLPFLGNLLQLDLKRLDRSLCALSKKYGSVFKIHFGPKKIIVLAGYKTVKEALVNCAEEFGEREIPPIFHDLTKELGILWANGDNWTVMRRFTLTTLRDLGMGKRGGEEKIIAEIQYLKGVFEKFDGKPFDTTHPISVAVSNIICAIIFGSRFHYEDLKFKAMVNRANENMKKVGSISIQLYNMFPKLFSRNKTWEELMKNTEINRHEMQQLMNSLQETLNVDDCRGFIDSFLICKESGENGMYFHDQNLLTTVSNLFVAGTDTTSATVRWGLLFMAKYPQIQEQVQEEIDRVIGDRQPVMEDRKNLPYTDAVIHETQRLANIVPMSLPHVTSCNVHFNGFFIKKGTCVMPLLTSVLLDESEWENPHTFNPAHFLDADGHFVKRDAFIPFSAGRRVCLGESLARMELFLFFTSLLQHFRFTPPPGVTEDQLDLTSAVGFILSPSQHELCAVPRI